MRDIKTAQYCERQGIEFLGIHQINAPLSQDKIKLFQDIRATTKKIHLVLVTQEKDMDRLLKMCLRCNWDYVQIHFKAEPEYLMELKNKIQERKSQIRIISVIDMSNLEEYNISRLSEIADYLLFDSSIRGGTGIPTDIETLRMIGQLAKKNSYFLAGGLNDENVLNALEVCEPFAVDVQSGVEFSIPELKHRKDLKRINSFVRVIESYNRDEKYRDESYELEI